jgi:hypothetical protein
LLVDTAYDLTGVNFPMWGVAPDEPVYRVANLELGGMDNATARHIDLPFMGVFGGQKRYGGRPAMQGRGSPMFMTKFTVQPFGTSMYEHLFGSNGLYSQYFPRNTYGRYGSSYARSNRPYASRTSWTSPQYGAGSRLWYFTKMSSGKSPSMKFYPSGVFFMNKSKGGFYFSTPNELLSMKKRVYSGQLLPHMPRTAKKKSKYKIPFYALNGKRNSRQLFSSQRI